MKKIFYPIIICIILLILYCTLIPCVLIYQFYTGTYKACGGISQFSIKEGYSAISDTINGRL